MRYAYYPGCSAESTAPDMHQSTLAVAKALGLDLVEPKGWTCCGATAGHQTDSLLSVALPAANLVKVQDMKLDMVVNCAACYNRMNVANHELLHNQRMREEVGKTLERDYDGSVRVRHTLELLLEEVGLPAIKQAVKNPLQGLKVACYYGCLLVRPPEVVKFDDPENPTSMDRLVNAMGAQSLEWPCKTDCCGGGFSISRTDIVLQLTESILEMAKSVEADCIAVSCPMCQVNLDLRQQDIKKKSGKEYNIPIVYLTQLLGLSLGLAPAELGLDKLIVPASILLEKLGAHCHA